MMARLDRDMPDGYAIPSSYSTVDEQERMLQSLGVTPGYGGNVGSSVTNQVSNTEFPNAGLQKPESTWVKAKTINTANGPVDVDANGVAEDGSVPVAIVPTGSGDFLTRNGFTAGPFPKELEQFFGPSAGVVGWKIITNEDGSQSLEVADSPNSSKTFGFKFSRDANGKYVPFKSSGGGGNGSGANGAGGSLTTSDGKTFTNMADYLAWQSKLDSDKRERQSAYDLLYQQFNQYGLGSLVESIKGLIQENVSPSEFAIRLQNTDAYKQRFAANQDRIKQGLRALTPAEYIGLEDQYQNIMRNYGLPASYYSKDAMGTQAGFNKFIANDVSAAELEDRIATAQKRVINADPAVTDALRQFYPDITNADILAYTLDPSNALENIKRKVTAAEIGGAALQQGLGTSASRAEELAKYGITKAQAQQGYGQIGEFLPTATKLGDIYQNQGLGAYNQGTAESEVFGTAGSAQAAQKRKKLAQLEQAQFGGQAGTSQGALDRGRQGSF